MKCPKCHYLSFDPEPRCRNCGYTLALDPDLAINLSSDEPRAPLADLELRGADAAPAEEAAPARRSATPPVEERVRRPRTPAPGPFDDMTPREWLDGAAGSANDRETRIDPAAEAARITTPDAPRPRPAARRTPAPATTELPLFVKGATSADVPAEREPEPEFPILDRPLIDTPNAPAPPLAVQRPKLPDAPKRPRKEPEASKLGPLDRDLLEGLQRIEHFEQSHAAAEARRARLENSVGVGKRLGAAAFDAALVGAIGLVVVWVTLRWCDLTWAQASALPTVPFALFVLLLAAGYLFMFTAASGQTIGKMLTGIRVVDAGAGGTEQGRVSVRQAMYRELVTVPSVLVLGAGFLPALFGDERALHDRVAQTRVVRA